MNIKDRNYITIQGWMRTELGLKGNDLLVYAIIYGFSQVENQAFTGSLQYLADWCGSTKQGIQKNLKNLIERKLIEKKNTGVNSVAYYTTELYHLYNSVVPPIQLSCTNNIDNKLDNISNTNISNKLDIKSIKNNTIQKSEFLKSSKKQPKQSLYDKCLALITDFTDDITIQQHLRAYLNRLLNNYEESNRPFYTNMFKGKLNQLKQFEEQYWLEIIKNTLDNGWVNFYNLKNNTKNKAFSEPDSLTCEKFTDEDKKRQDKFLKELEKNGKRTTF